MHIPHSSCPEPEMSYIVLVAVPRWALCSECMQVVAAFSMVPVPDVVEGKPQAEESGVLPVVTRRRRPSRRAGRR